jgi:hypothetical protein
VIMKHYWDYFHQRRRHSKIEKTPLIIITRSLTDLNFICRKIHLNIIFSNFKYLSFVLSFPVCIIMTSLALSAILGNICYISNSRLSFYAFPFHRSTSQTKSLPRTTRKHESLRRYRLSTRSATNHRQHPIQAICQQQTTWTNIALCI